MNFAQLRQYIYDYIKANGFGLINGSQLQTALLNLLDLTQGLVTGWLKPGTSTPITSNNDDAYRTGKTIFGRTTDNGTGAMLQVEGKAVVNHLTSPELEIRLEAPDNAGVNQNNFFGWLKFRGSVATEARYSGIRGFGQEFTDQIGMAFFVTRAGAVTEVMRLIPSSGKVAIGPFGASIAGGTTITGGLNADAMEFPSNIAARKIVMYSVGPNDHQFYGFGVLGGAMLYQIPTSGDSHVFAAGYSPTTSRELMRIKADGCVGIGIPTPDTPLQVSATNPSPPHLGPSGGGVVMEIQNNAPSAQNGVRMTFHQAGIAIWAIGSPPQTDAFCIYGWNKNGNQFPEYMRIDKDGVVLFDGTVFSGFIPISGIPTTAQLGNNKIAAFKNLQNGQVRLWVNNGGAMQSILFQ